MKFFYEFEFLGVAANAGFLSGFSGIESSPGPELPRIEFLDKFNGLVSSSSSSSLSPCSFILTDSQIIKMGFDFSPLICRRKPEEVR